MALPLLKYLNSNFALCFALMGLFLLFFFLLIEPRKFTSFNDTLPSERVLLSGLVVNESFSEKNHFFFLEGVQIYTDSSKVYAGLNVSVLGIVERYREKPYIRARRIIIQ